MLKLLIRLFCTVNERSEHNEKAISKKKRPRRGAVNYILDVSRS